jgi:hypothetical protein
VVPELLVTVALAAPPAAGDGTGRPGMHDRAVAVARARYRWRTVGFRQRTVRPYRAWLAKVRQCESGGRYRTATGNGFWGAYQFTLSSWHAVGGRGYPHQARPLEQDYRAVRLLHLQGRGAWPICG